MTSFEYLSVIVAIVIALGITQILIGAGRVALGDGTVRSYWIHSVWLAFLLIIYLHTWVSMWSLREATEQAVGIFLFYLVGTALPFVAGQVLLAGSFPSDAEAHYFRVKRRFFGLQAAGSVWAFAHHNQVLDSPSGGFPQLLAVPLLILLGATSNWVVHAVLSPLFLLGTLLSFLGGPGQNPLRLLSGQLS